MATNPIYVSPTDATSQVIRVGGTCYDRKESTRIAPTITSADIQEHKAHCSECVGPCPGDCVTCPETFVATLTGATGTYTPPTPDVYCSSANGTYTLTRTLPDACDWSSQTTGPSGWYIVLYCYENAWWLSLSNYDQYNLEFYRWTQPHTSACPPATGWTPYSPCYGCPCTAGTVMIS